MQFDGGRRSHAVGTLYFPDTVSECAEVGTPLAENTCGLRNHPRNRGLAVRPGDANDAELFRRAAVEPVRDLAELAGQVIHCNERHASVVRCGAGRCIPRDGRNASLECRVHEVEPVMRHAGHGKEQVTPPQLPAVARNARHGNRGRIGEAS